MSISSRCSGHQVTKYTKTQTTGSALGLKEEYTATETTLTCRVVPQFKYRGMPQERQMLAQQGVLVPYTIYFSSDPALDERHGLLWGETFMRVVGPARDAHGAGRLYILQADALSIDNANATIA